MAFKGLIAQAMKMLKMSNKKFKEIEIGSSVKVLILLIDHDKSCNGQNRGWFL